MKQLSLYFMLIIALSLALVGCNQQAQDETTELTEDKLTIYTTIYPLEFFASQIGGNHVEVENIVPPGADGHTYEPTAKTMVKIAEADAFIYSGSGIEGFADAIKDAMKNEDVRMVEAAHDIELIAHGVEEEKGHDDHAAHEEEEAHDDHAEHEEEAHDDHAEHEEEETHDDHAEHADEEAHDHGNLDPHVWLDPLLAIQLSENILNVLVELKPESKDEFQKNFDQLKVELEKLNQEFTEAITQSTKKEILVAHAAYGYWEARYGIEQISVSGLSPTNEPSQQELTNIIETAKEHDINYVLFEQNVSTKIADIVKKEIKAEALTLHNLETLTENDLTANEDYFTMMRKNLETLKTALNN
ncbi:metal ABC transporter solute-binding protein, Zn/Mn family [Bacillus pinisoli]|uniref:metal ABC transporter solute-binding protein, Zn/Mn family n=1 Tax=Bacillus pinisoli TaxID=2901866 RepID=UPI001FF270BD|nr:zinc ABC transporter substrate-binding protein [Bacillus pinisoli]